MWTAIKQSVYDRRESLNANDFRILLLGEPSTLPIPVKEIHASDDQIDFDCGIVF